MLKTAGAGMVNTMANTVNGAVTGFGGLKAGLDNGKSASDAVRIAGKTIKTSVSADVTTMKQGVIKGVSAIKQGVIKGISKVAPAMGSSAPGEMCSGESGSNNADRGYYQDKNGRWHRSNGQYVSNSEVTSENVTLVTKEDLARIDSWKYRPSNKQYVENKAVYDNPKYYNRK